MGEVLGKVWIFCGLNTTCKIMNKKKLADSIFVMVSNIFTCHLPRQKTAKLISVRFPLRKDVLTVAGVLVYLFVYSS